MARLGTRQRFSHRRAILVDARSPRQCIDVRQIAYDPFYDQPAVLRGGYQIELDFIDSGLFEGWYDIDESGHWRASTDYLNLEGTVDSPIASIEWGQPIFYDTFMLTATEYLPRTVTIAGGA